MGTNYYHHKEVKPACECCKRGPDIEVRHIGKSSAGWCFSLHVIPEDGITCLEDWEARWAEPGTWIEDEYRERISPEQMRKKVTWRPYGTHRHSLDGHHCVGHGEGSWDYIAGEFS